MSRHINLRDEAEKIVESGQACRHATTTVWAALYWTDASGLNEANCKIHDMKEKGAPPRWLIKRWATIAGLLNGRS